MGLDDLSGIPAPYRDEKTDGEENPLLVRRVRVYRSGRDRPAPPRAPGEAPVGPLPYDRRWDFAMRATSSDEFQRRIEAIHDDVHVWVGGIMRDITWAAYDAVLRPSRVVDRAWRLWQHRNPGALPPAELLDVPLRPNGITVREVLDVKQLGYEYALSASHVQGPGS